MSSSWVAWPCFASTFSRPALFVLLKILRPSVGGAIQVWDAKVARLRS